MTLNKRTKIQKVGVASVMLAMSIWTGYQADTAIGIANASPSSQQCEEDQPCWNCSTMGNHHCGPDIAIGSDGQMIDCTVTDRYGNRMDWHQECDGYWAMAT